MLGGLHVGLPNESYQATNQLSKQVSSIDSKGKDRQVGEAMYETKKLNVQSPQKIPK